MMLFLFMVIPFVLSCNLQVTYLGTRPIWTDIIPNFLVRNKNGSWKSDDTVVIKIGTKMVNNFLPGQSLTGFAERKVVTIEFQPDSIKFSMQLHPDTDAERWLMILDINEDVCKREYLQTQKTPNALLYWHFDRDSTNTFHGPRKKGCLVRIVCTRLYGYKRVTVQLDFPEHVQLEENTHIGVNKVANAVKLKPEYKNVNVICIVDNTSVSANDLLQIDAIEDDRTVQINSYLHILVYFSIIFAFIVVPLGTYLGIVKQRKMYNMKRVRKIAKVAQNQLNLMSTSNYMTVRQNTIMQEAGQTPSRKFKEKVNRVRKETMGATNIEAQMSKIEQLHDLAKMESAALDSNYTSDT